MIGPAEEITDKLAALEEMGVAYVLLFSQGSHYVDVIRWLIGPLKSVYAKKASIEILTANR